MHDGMLVEFAGVLLLAAGLGGIAILLRQPLIIAFIAVGIIVGPTGADLISESEAWDLLAATGISLLLFVVGLRLDLDEIRATGPVALITGLGQVIFTSAIGFGLALALGLSAVPALYVAVALTFSSTIIIVKLLSDKREIDSLHGRIAVGFLIVQDIVVVLVMIAISALSVEGADPVREGVLVVLRGVAMVGGIYLAMRFVVPWLFAILARQQELLVLGAIAWAIALAVGGEMMGFSTEVGAFLAGVSLASTRFRDAIGARLVSLRDFLLLFFFVTLGAGLDLSLLGNQIVPAILLSLFVLIGNPLIVLAIMAVMGYRARTGFLAGLTVAQISEFSLILGALGLNVGHIDDDVMALITLVGLITIGTSTYLILYSHLIWERVAPVLSRFERATPYREQESDFSRLRANVIILGLGRFGGALARRLVETNHRVLAIDFDPAVVQSWTAEGLSVRYGDVEDPELYESLPLDVDWIVSSLPSLSTNLHLLEVLRWRGFAGRVALTAHTERAARTLTEHDADLVLVPFVEAAAHAAAYITGDESLDYAPAHAAVWHEGDEFVEPSP